MPLVHFCWVFSNIPYITIKDTSLISFLEEEKGNRMSEDWALCVVEFTYTSDIIYRIRHKTKTYLVNMSCIQIYVFQTNSSTGEHYYLYHIDGTST